MVGYQCRTIRLLHCCTKVHRNMEEEWEGEERRRYRERNKERRARSRERERGGLRGRMTHRMRASMWVTDESFDREMELGRGRKREGGGGEDR